MLQWAYEHVWTKWKIESHRKEMEDMKKKQMEILEPIYNINEKKKLSRWFNSRNKRTEEKSKSWQLKQ